MTDQTSPALSAAPERGDAARSAREAFRRAFGTDPTGVWSAPGRVNIIGEHVDYQDGLCLPMAISHRCFAAVARTDRPFVRLRSQQSDKETDVATSDLRPGRVDGWAAYAAGVCWALPGARAAIGDGGLDILVDGQVPLGSGLSSSAALECSVSAALNDLLGLRVDPLEQVHACIRAETEFAGASTGGLDQAASILARKGTALLLDCRDFATSPVPWDLAGQGLAMLICDTRAEHSHVDGEYAARRADSERAATILGVPSLRDVPYEDASARLPLIGDPIIRRRARHVITEIERVREMADLLDSGTIRENLTEIGHLLNASHDSLRDDYEVTVPALDVAVDAARAAGAHGARMTGGGFGGSVIALIESDAPERVARQIVDAFATHGITRAPQFFLALPEQGAGADL